MKTPHGDYSQTQQFGIHIAKNGKTYRIFTGYNDNGSLCAFPVPQVPLVDPEFLHVNAILHQALDDRKVRVYFDTYPTPAPITYD